MKALILTLGSLLAVPAQGTTYDKPELSANSMKAAIAAQSDEGVLYTAYVTGLARGAYFSYVHELVRGGMPSKAAMQLADKQCGRLTPWEIFDILVKDEKLGDAPIHLSMPTFVLVVCHKGEAAS